MTVAELVVKSTEFMQEIADFRESHKECVSTSHSIEPIVIQFCMMQLVATYPTARIEFNGVSNVAKVTIYRHN